MLTSIFRAAAFVRAPLGVRMLASKAGLATEALSQLADEADSSFGSVLVQDLLGQSGFRDQKRSSVPLYCETEDLVCDAGALSLLLPPPPLPCSCACVPTAKAPRPRSSLP
jgi:hypothetical protein